MADKSGMKFYRTLLAIGFLLVLAGMTYYVVLPAKKIEGFLVLLFFILMFLSACVVYISLVLSKAILFYGSLNLFIYSVIELILNTHVIQWNASQLWPIMMIAFGVTLIPSGYLRYKKMRTIYTIPAVVLSFLGFVFILFSFDIIAIPFKTFILFAWPAVLIFCGVILILYYLYAQKYKDKDVDDSYEDTSEDSEFFGVESEDE